jgi:nucleoside-diphosphate-sugar epimerase
MKRTVLVLGAGGYVGRKLMSALARCEDIQPTAGLRRPSAMSDYASICVDATDSAELEKHLSGFDAVINCVGSDPTVMLHSTHALLRAAQASRPLIVHFSSMAVYGSSCGPVDEKAPLRGDTGAYANAKVETERLMAAYPRRVVLRPGCIYGPGSPAWSNRIARLLQARRLGDLGAAGDGVANLVHVDDVAVAVIAAIRQPQCEGEVFNLAMKNPPTWNDYFICFAKALGAVPVRRVGERTLKVETRIVAPFLKVCEIVSKKLPFSFDLPPFISPALLSLFRQDITLVSDKAERVLGLQWRNLEESLRDVAAFEGKPR